jgi:hypothetical protein
MFVWIPLTLFKPDEGVEWSVQISFSAVIFSVSPECLLSFSI